MDRKSKIAPAFFVFLFLGFCAKKPEYPEFLSIYAKARYDIERGRLREAEEKYELLLSKYPDKITDNFDFFVQLAVLKVRLGKTKEAERIIAWAKPKTVRQYIILARTLQKYFGDVEKSIRVLEEALERFPSNTLVFNIVANWWLRRDPQKALRIAKKFVEKNPKSFVGRLILARALGRVGKKKEATEEYRKALKLRFSERVVLELVRHLEEMAEWESARQVLEDALKISNNISLRDKLVRILVKLKEWDRAIEVAKGMVRDFPEPELKILLLDILMRAGRYNDCITLAQSIISDSAVSPTDSDRARIIKGYCLFYAEDYEGAIREAELVRSGGKLREYAVMLKIMALREIDPQRSIEYAFEVSRQSFFPALAQSIAFSYREIEDYANAIRILDWALRKYPNDSELLYTKAYILYEMEKFEDALRIAEILVRREPKNADFLNFLGYLLADLDKDLERALKLVLLADKLKPREAYIIDSIGWVYFKMGDIDKAEKYIRMAYELEPNDAVITEHLADIYLRKGMLEEALKLYEESLEKDPKGFDRKRIMRKIKELRQRLFGSTGMEK